MTRHGRRRCGATGGRVYALLTEDRQRAVRSIEIAAELGRAGAAPLPSPWWGLWPLLRAVHGGDVEDALAATERGVPDRWNEMMRATRER